MEVDAAIGVASGIIAFLGFSWKLVSGANDLYDSGRRVTKENARISHVIKDLKEHSLELGSEQLGGSKHEKALKALSKECHGVCEELIAILDGLEAKKSSRWAAMRAMWASMRQSKEVAHIESRLSQYRMEMNSRLLALLSERQSTVKKQLDKIQTEAQSMSLRSAEDLKLLRADFVKLLAKLDEDDDDESEVSTAASSDDRKDHQEHVENVREHLFTSLSEISVKIDHLRSLIQSTPKESRILHHLYFEGIFNRVDSIVDPSEGTFEWIFSPTQPFDDSQPEEHFLMLQARGREIVSQQFLDWLQGDSGIFYISGKAGCGKSTLMKFMANHQRTTELLQQWAGDRTVAIASFFFWQSDGQKLQMTLDGMYRSILFFVLRHCPHLIPNVLPEQWEVTNSTRESAIGESELYRVPNIKAAFERLMNLTLPSDDVRFCLFIDGLDEYKADPYDQKLFAVKLRDWAEGSFIKICVSSRPEVQFIDTFPSRIHLHEVTQGDIYLSTRGIFENDKSFDRISSFYVELVEKIVLSADGVFLWARLVVKELLVEAGMHSSYTRMCQKLNSTPTQLDDLYEFMLSSMPRDDRRKIRLLLMLVATNPFRTPLPTFVFDFINASGDIDIDLINSRKSYTAETLIRDQERISRQLQGLTKGILVTVCPTYNSNPVLQILRGIGFFHKTVKDYILSSEHSVELSRSSPCSDFPNIHALLRMAEVTRMDCLMSRHGESLQGHLLNIFATPISFEMKTLLAFEMIWMERFAHTTAVAKVIGSQSSSLGNVEIVDQTTILHPFLSIAAYNGQVHFLKYRLGGEPPSNEIEALKALSNPGLQDARSTQSPSSLRTPENVLFPALWKLTSLTKDKVASHSKREMHIKTLELLLSRGFSMTERVPLMEQPTYHVVRDVSLWVLFVFCLSQAVRSGQRVLRPYLDALRIILRHEKQENATILFRCNPAYFPLNYRRESVRFRSLTLHEVLLVADSESGWQKEDIFGGLPTPEHEAESDDMLRSWLKGQQNVDFDETVTINRWTTSGLIDDIGEGLGYPYLVAGVVTRTECITDQLNLVARLW